MLHQVTFPGGVGKVAFVRLDKIDNNTGVLQQFAKVRLDHSIILLPTKIHFLKCVVYGCHFICMLLRICTVYIYIYIIIYLHLQCISHGCSY